MLRIRSATFFNTVLFLFWLFYHTHSNALIDIADTHYYEKLIHEHNQLVVEFFSYSCGICNSIQKPFKEVTQESAFKNITFAQVDIDVLPNLAQTEHIVGTPTFKFIDHGIEIKEIMGVKDIEKFKDTFRNQLETIFDASNVHSSDTFEESPKHDNELTLESSAESAEHPWYYHVYQALIRFLQALYKYILYYIHLLRI